MDGMTDGLVTGIIGFLVIGIIAGFLARLLVPGKDAMGIGTLRIEFQCSCELLFGECEIARDDGGPGNRDVHQC